MCHSVLIPLIHPNEQGRRFFTAIFIKKLSENRCNPLVFEGFRCANRPSRIVSRDEGHAEWQRIHDAPEWGMQAIFKEMGEEDFAPVLLDLE